MIVVAVLPYGVIKVSKTLSNDFPVIEKTDSGSVDSMAFQQ